MTAASIREVDAAIAAILEALGGVNGDHITVFRKETSGVRMSVTVRNDDVREDTVFDLCEGVLVQVTHSSFRLYDGVHKKTFTTPVHGTKAYSLDRANRLVPALELFEQSLEIKSFVLSTSGVLKFIFQDGSTQVVTAAAKPAPVD